MRKYRFTLSIPVVLFDGENPDDITRRLSGVSGKELLERLGISGPVFVGKADILMEAYHGVDVTCGGESIHWSTREAAIKFYTDACNGCDPGSSEHSRYSLVLSRLLSGMVEVTDQ